MIPEKKKSQKKTIVVSCIVAGLVVVSIVCVWAITAGGEKTPDASKQSPEEIEEFIRSDEFRELEPRERRDFFRKTMESRMARQAEDYFNKPADMRVVFIDEVIDSMQTRREEFMQMREMFDPNEFGGRRGGGEAERFGPLDGRGGEGRGERDRQNRRAPSLERRRARQESVSPITRAQTREFRRALRRRMQER